MYFLLAEVLGTLASAWLVIGAGPFEEGGGASNPHSPLPDSDSDWDALHPYCHDHSHWCLVMGYIVQMPQNEFHIPQSRSK